MIAFTDGTTQVITQLQAPTDPIFQSGHPVMVQFGATQNVVLDASKLPNSVRQPKQVIVQGSPRQNGTVGVQSCQAALSGGTIKESCTTQ